MKDLFNLSKKKDLLKFTTKTASTWFLKYGRPIPQVKLYILNYRKKSLDKNKFNSTRKIVWDIFVIAQGLRTWKELIIE